MIKRTRLATYKLYWMLQQDGAWQHPDSLFASAGKGAWKADAFGNDGVQLTSCEAETNVPSHYSFAVTMPSAPAIPQKASVYGLDSYYDKKHSKIYVDWNVLPSSAPQLSYRLALYDNEQCSGKPIAECEGVDPDDRLHSIKMRNDLPERWIKKGIQKLFSDTVSKNENFSFQLGIYALQNLSDVKVMFSDLKSLNNHTISAKNISCLNTDGTS